jgi:hypothetical protein
MRKILQIRNIAVVSLLGFVMMFASIAPTMNSAYAGDPASSFCQSALGPNWVGIADFDVGISLAKCFNLDDPCFAEGVPVKSDGPTTCVIAIVALNLTGQNVILKDAIPAEWGVEVQLVQGLPNATFNCDDNLDQANKGKKADKSATLLTCDATTLAFVQGAVLEITTRESQGSLKGNQEIAKFKPTSCELFANSGAQLILADALGEPVLDDLDQPIVLAETGPLEVLVIGEECEQPVG